MSDEHAENTTEAAIDDFDLGDLAAVHTAQMTVMNPRTKLPLPWVWTLAGPGHPATVAMQNKMGMRDRAEAFNERKAMQTGRDPKIQTNPEVSDIVVRRYSARVLDFNPVKFNGRQLKFSPDEAHTILKDPDFGWLWVQVFNFINADDAFIPASPQT